MEETENDGVDREQVETDEEVVNDEEKEWGEG